MPAYVLLHDNGQAAELLEESVDAMDDEEAVLLAQVRLASGPNIQRIVILRQSQQVQIVIRAN